MDSPWNNPARVRGARLIGIATLVLVLTLSTFAAGGLLAPPGPAADAGHAPGSARFHVLTAPPPVVTPVGAYNASSAGCSGASGGATSTMRELFVNVTKGASLYVFLAATNISSTSPTTVVPTSVTDNASDTFTLAQSAGKPGTPAVAEAWYYVDDLPKRTDLVVTGHWPAGSDTVVGMCTYQATGTAEPSLDAAGASNSGVGTAVSASVTTTKANDMVIAAWMAGAGTELQPPTLGAGQSYVNGNTIVVANLGIGTDSWEAQATPGAQTQTGSYGSSQTWMADSVAIATDPIPPAPTNLAVTAASGSAIALSWTNPGVALTNESVLYGTSCSNLTTILSTGGNVSSYTVQDLRPSTSYSFEVRAWGTGGGSAPSSCVSGTTSPAGTPAPNPSSGGAVVTSAPWWVAYWPELVGLSLVAAVVILLAVGRRRNRRKEG